MALRRRKTRILAMQILFAYEVSREPIERLFALMTEDADGEKEEIAFIDALVYKVLGRQAELDEIIKRFAQHWEFERIALIDRVLLRMAMAEVLHFPDIPPKVSINEAIEIAKQYSTENSGAFLNGILDAFLTDLREKNALEKSGRGLIGLDEVAGQRQL